MDLHAQRRGEGRLRLNLTIGGATVATITLIRDVAAAGDIDLSSAPLLDVTHGPLDFDFADVDGGWPAQWLVPAPNAASLCRALFPQLDAVWGPERLLPLALMSTVVGMACPGRHSIFSEFDLRWRPRSTPREGLGFQPRTYDRRTRLAHIDMASSAFSGEITAFVREAPVAPALMASIAGRVDPSRYAGQRVLVIGGSRGLGAATAKILASAGAAVTLTYAKGREEAEAVARDINAARGAGTCAVLPYDIALPPEAQLRDPTPIDHLFYFPTPRIFRRSTRTFDAQFAACYVTAFEALVRCCLARQPDHKLTAYYPSSVAVTQRPRGMTEYAMAKAAGEVLCHDLARASKTLDISVYRLPRVRTDQTATVPPVPAADPVDAMLDWLALNEAAPV